MTTLDKIEQGNKMGVSAQGNTILIMMLGNQRMTEDWAVNMAIHVLAMACPEALSEAARKKFLNT